LHIHVVLPKEVAYLLKMELERRKDGRPRKIPAGGVFKSILNFGSKFKQ